MRAHALPYAFLVFFAAAPSAQEITVKVERHGESVVVDVEAHVAGALREAWAVFTDYDNMASFISNLSASKVLERKNNLLEVSQTGRTQVGFMTFGFEAVRAVELVPMHEIRSSFVSGDFKSYTSTTSLAPSGSRGRGSAITASTSRRSGCRRWSGRR